MAQVSRGSASVKPVNYQLAIEFKEPLLIGGTLEQQRDSLKRFQTINTLREEIGGLVDFGQHPLVGKYTRGDHIFYMATSKDRANEFAKAAKNTGLVKAVHIDKFGG